MEVTSLKENNSDVIKGIKVMSLKGNESDVIKRER